MKPTSSNGKVPLFVLDLTHINKHCFYIEINKRKQQNARNQHLKIKRTDFGLCCSINAPNSLDKSIKKNCCQPQKSINKFCNRKIQKLAQSQCACDAN